MTAQEILAKLDAVKVEVTKNTEVGQAVVTLVTGQSAMIAALREQIEDLIANGSGGATQEQLQAFADGLTLIEEKTKADTAAIAAAVTANTE